MIKDAVGYTSYPKYWRETGALKTLQRCRKKYGQQGVTETAKQFFESKPFIRKLHYERTLYGDYSIKAKCNCIADSVFNENSMLKNLKNFFNKNVYSWK